MGLEPRFELDARLVEERHRELSKALHPDRFAGAPATERRLALSRAIEVNDARRTLKDPVKRAEALLARAGVKTGEGVEPPASGELLMEMMELREDLQTIATARDSVRLGLVKDRTRFRERALLAELGRVLDREGPKAAALPLLGELRYVRRVLDEVGALEETFAEA